MPRIVLYITKLDMYNRMGSISDYSNYLMECDNFDFQISKPFTNKSGVLYISETSNQYFLSHYQEYNYAIIDAKVGVVLHAFVRLTPLATGGFRVDVTPDYWYTYLTKKSDNKVDLHGRCIRAHINDWEEYNKTTQYFSRPTLKNTYLIREEDCSLYALKNKSTPYIGDVGNNMSDYDIKRTRYIYIYIQNPSSSLLDDNTYSAKQTISSPYGKYDNNGYMEDRGIVSSTNGLTICGVVASDGLCFFHSKITDDTTLEPLGIIGKTVKHISELTSEYITSMFITDIPPVVGAKISKYSIDGVYYYCVDYEDTDLYNRVSLFEGGTRSDIGIATGFVSKFCVCLQLDIKVEINLSNIYLENAVINANSSIRRGVGSIYSHIVKSKSQVYKPISSCDNIIDTINTDSVIISLSPDGSTYFTYINNKNLGLNSALSTSINSRLFAPDTVRDYWTSLNAERASIAAQVEKFNTIGKFAKSTVNMLQSIGDLGFNGGMMLSDPRNVAEYGGKTIGSTFNMVSSSIDFATDSATLPLNLRASAINAEIAEKQMADGITQSSSYPSYYAAMTYEKQLDIVSITINYNSLYTIEEQLNRYGYATFLLLEDVLENHIREKFNYVQCSQVEIHGCDSDIAKDIENMFMHGVHLWHTINVGDYAVQNYQVSAEIITE